ncbi:MAG TPA: DUF1684 domain-containing protein, partial [Glaciihabitans sp.]|nr:DUF1684 domain-containing protein [Glaciihabitans sp.]
HTVWQRERDTLFAKHPSSPLLPDDLAKFEGLPITAYDPAWRFELPLIDIDEPKRMDVETGTDGIVPFEQIGIVRIPNVGELDVWRLASYGGGIFIPVKDALAGKPGGTYGGGRYLIDTVKGADLGFGADATVPGNSDTLAIPESLVLDFNFAYNPSCAYDPAWACPLAQPGNRVAVEIPVGERYLGSGH